MIQLAPDSSLGYHWRVPFCTWLCLLSLGCGGGTTETGPAVVTPPPPPPPKAVAVAAAPAPAAAAPTQPNNAVQATLPTTGSVNNFPKENISDVFVTGETGTPMTVVMPPQLNPQDQFAVTLGVPTANSQNFSVAAGTAVAQGAPNPNATLPEGFSAIESFGYAPDGYPLRIRGDVDGKVMAYVPGGAAKVGSNDGPPESSPAFETFLDSFYMDVTEVTVGEYEAFRQNQRDNKRRVPTPPANLNQGNSFPVLGVSFGDATIYARWAEKQLPTEAQFELAARGPQGFPHPWGFGRAVWPRPRTLATISEVAEFPGDVSIYGIYDLAGNAKEWLADLYSTTSHQEAAKLSQGRSLTNWPGPKQSAQGNLRVIKGAGPHWEVWYRSGGEMSERRPDVGFRCVLPIVPKPATASLP